jgi:hypothetical protein
MGDDGENRENGENGFNCNVFGGVVYEGEGGGQGQLNPRLSI